MPGAHPPPRAGLRGVHGGGDRDAHQQRRRGAHRTAGVHPRDRGPLHRPRLRHRATAEVEHVAALRASHAAPATAGFGVVSDFQCPVSQVFAGPEPQVRVADTGGAGSGAGSDPADLRDAARRGRPHDLAAAPVRGTVHIRAAERIAAGVSSGSRVPRSGSSGSPERLPPGVRPTACTGQEIQVR